MTRQLLLTHDSSRATRLAIVLEDGTAHAIYAEHGANPSLVGNCYVGKVVRVLAKQSIVFVDIGEKRSALLHFDDCDKPPTQGEKILVQVIKDAIDDKGARLSTKIRLVLPSLVYLPTERNALHVSKKIHDEALGKQLTDTVKTLMQINLVQGTMIVRSNAQLDSDLGEQVSELHKKWQTILQQKQAHYLSKTAKLLYQEKPFFAKMVTQWANKDCHIIVDDECILSEIASAPHISIQYTPTLRQTFKVEQIVANALSSTIALPSGGFLVIDEVEAMAVIDVNAGSSNDNAQTNCEATIAIAHAIRLKNISGIIVIDFIDMPKSAQADIIKQLKCATQNDCVRTQVYAFSRLGLLEMTRERINAPLSKVLTTRY